MTQDTDGEGEYVETDVSAVRMFPFYVPVEYNPETGDIRFCDDQKVEATSDPGFFPRTDHFSAQDGTRLDDEETAVDYLAAEYGDGESDTGESVQAAIYREMLALVDDERFVIAQMDLDERFHDPMKENAPEGEWSVENARDIARIRLQNLMSRYDEYGIDEYTREEYPAFAERVDELSS